MPRPFLRAYWNSLAFLNYEIAPSVLEEYVPDGTCIDSWQGKTLISLVGFRFTKAKLRGLSIPFHSDFSEVNLRFYVRKTVDEDVRRGVVFIKEVVPLPAIVFVARAVYNERYVCLPMRFAIDPRGATYQWRLRRKWNAISVRVAGEFEPAEPGSEEAFVTEHFWGYVRKRDGSTAEYKVEHPPWKIARTVSSSLRCDVAAMYGASFTEALSREPISAFFAEGSEVSVFPAQQLAPSRYHRIV